MIDRPGPRQRALPPQLVAMVRRVPPAGAPVVPGSVPVVAFGDPERAEVATLGINPSHREFAENGVLLSGERRRLATLESLGVARLDQLTDGQVADVVADCAAYFHRNPYRRWFDPLDSLLRASTGCGYYDGSACHLDLVQWATDPAWNGITDPDMRQILLDDGVPHLRAQLASDNVRIVLLNGRQVINQVLAADLTTLDEVGSIPRRGDRCRLYTGDGGGVRWIGWSTNLQSSFVVSNAFKDQLAERISELCQQTSGTRDADEYAAAGYLPLGTRVSNKRELAELLATWLRRSQMPTIGDVGSFGGRPWLHIDLGTHDIALNADTKRAAVEEFVRTRRRPAVVGGGQPSWPGQQGAPVPRSQAAARLVRLPVPPARGRTNDLMNAEIATVVQFPHPGAEHNPPADDMPWNASLDSSSHSSGDAVVGDKRGAHLYESLLLDLQTEGGA